MSGQPYRYASDIENFRNDYMESLGLRANLDDMNLQANKNYKETGALPPKSSMKDTRTTAEILADTEKLKLSLIAELKSVCSVQMAQSVIQKVQQSPLNADGSFLIWFSQNAPEIVQQLKKKYKFGIAGNENDVEQMVAFMSSIFSKTKDMSSSVKSAFDRPTNSLNGGISEGDLTELRKNFDQIQFKLVSQAQAPDTPEKLEMLKLFTEIRNQFDALTRVLDTSIYNRMKEIFLSTSANQGNMTQVNINYQGYTQWLEFVDKLPSSSALRTLLDQLNKSEKNKNLTLSIQILINLSSLLPTVQDTTRISGIIYRVITGNNPAIIQQTGQQQQIAGPQAPPLQVHQGPPPNIPMGGITAQTANDISKLILMNIYDEVIRVGLGLPILPGTQSTFMTGRFLQPLFHTIENMPNIDSVNVNTDQLRHAIDIFTTNNHTAPDMTYMSDQIAPYNDSLEYANDKLPILNNIIRNSAGYSMTGFGLHGKRRGRPKGSGLVKPISERIDHTKGIKQGHIHVPFGKYILNKNKLDSDLVYFKHNKGYGVKGFPMTKVSKNLGSILRTIIGGGVPKFEDLSNLSEHEKEYLHKVSKQAGIMDKISIPTPSKDKQEQDIHQFEVMKGELLSGNDSPELVKKFKLILLRLSKNGTIPKRESMELMEDLIQLGF